jgi:Rieske Fe-S protein
MNEKAMIMKRTIDRRSFISVATWAIGGLISAGLGIPAVAYIVGPAMKSSKIQNWIKLGSTSKVELGTPTLFNARIERQQFFCPCHNGVYDKQGNVVSGPPPRPLDRYELKVDGEQIFMGKLYRVEG